MIAISSHRVLVIVLMLLLSYLNLMVTEKGIAQSGSFSPSNFDLHLSLNAGYQFYPPLSHSLSSISFAPQLLGQIEFGISYNKLLLAIGRGLQNVEIEERLLLNQFNQQDAVATLNERRYFSTIRLSYVDHFKWSKLKFNPFIGLRKFDQSSKTLFSFGGFQSNELEAFTRADTYHGKQLLIQTGIEVLKADVEFWKFSLLLGLEIATRPIYEHRIESTINGEFFNRKLTQNPISAFSTIKLSL